MGLWTTQLPPQLLDSSMLIGQVESKKAEALPTDTECSPMIAATDQPSSQSAKWDVGGRGLEREQKQSLR